MLPDFSGHAEMLPGFLFLQGRLLIYQNFQHLWTFEMDKKHKVDTVDRIAGRPNPSSNLTPSQNQGFDSRREGRKKWDPLRRIIPGLVGRVGP